MLLGFLAEKLDLKFDMTFILDINPPLAVNRLS